MAKLILLEKMNESHNEISVSPNNDGKIACETELIYFNSIECVKDELDEPDFTGVQFQHLGGVSEGDSSLDFTKECNDSLESPQLSGGEPSSLKFSFSLESGNVDENSISSLLADRLSLADIVSRSDYSPTESARRYVDLSSDEENALYSLKDCNPLLFDSTRRFGSQRCSSSSSADSEKNARNFVKDYSSWFTDALPRANCNARIMSENGVLKRRKVYLTGVWERIKECEDELQADQIFTCPDPGIRYICLRDRKFDSESSYDYYRDLCVIKGWYYERNLLASFSLDILVFPSLFPFGVVTLFLTYFFLVLCSSYSWITSSRRILSSWYGFRKRRFRNSVSRMAYFRYGSSGRQTSCQTAHSQIRCRKYQLP